MANNQNKIQFQLDFKTGDIKAFNDLKSQLNEVRAMASDVTLGITPSNMQATLNSVNAIERALNKAYDPTLNTVNIQKFNKILKESGLDAQKLQQNLSIVGAEGQSAFLKLTTQLMQFNTATKQTNKFLDDIATSLFNTIKQSAMSSIINNITGTIQKSYYYVKDLDSALNDIRIVTNKSADDMANFAEEANNAAKALAVTTEDYTQGSLIYYQQGLDDETVKTLTDITAKTSNVTAQSMSTVSEQLTAVQNGYKVANQAAEEGMQVYEQYVDKMAAVGASTASDLQELSTAMSKVASAASSMGVDFDDLNAQIATIVSVTRQAPESVGTALKTIYARLGDLKVDGVDEFGTKLGEVSGQLQTMGINIIDQQGNMRNMSDVIVEVASKQDTWTEAQRQAAAVAMAGKRQYNNLIALFDNQDMYGEALETSMNAAGTLEKQQEIALESLANKMDVLKTTAEDLYDSLFNTDTISGFVEAGTGVLQFLANFTDSVGGLNNILPMLLSTMTGLFSSQIANGIGTIVNNLRIMGDQAKIDAQNMQELQTMFANSFIQNNSGNDAQQQAAAEARESLKSFYNEMQQYRSLMTQEEKEQYNLTLNNIEAAGSMNQELIKQEEHWLKTVNNLKLIEPALLKDTKQVGLLAQEAEKFKNIAENLNQGGFHSAFDFADELATSRKELNLTDKQFDAIVKKFNDLVDKGIPVEKAVKRIANELNNLGTKTETIVDLRNKMENAKSAADGFGESLRKNLDTRLLIQNITSTISTLGQLTMSIQTLKNIGNIFDNDELSDTEKLTQVITNLGFSIPFLATSLTNLTGILDKSTNLFSALTQAINKKTAATKIDKISNEVGIESSKLMQMATTKENLATRLATMAKTDYAKANGISVKSIDAETVAEIEETAAKQAEIVATEKAVIEQEKLNVTILKNPYVLAAAALGTLVVALGALIIAEQKAKEEARQARIEEQKLYEEQRKNKREEIEKNQELYQSYTDLYALYEKHSATKEQMANKTDELVDLLGEERVAVAQLTGDYESLNKEILEHRKLEIQEKHNQNQDDIQANQEKMQNLVGATVISDADEQLRESVKNNSELSKVFEVDDNSGKIYFKLDPTDEEAFRNFPNAIITLSNIINQSENIFASGQREQLLNFQSGILPYYTNIADIKADDELINIQNDLIDKYDLSNFESYTEFTNAVQFAFEKMANENQSTADTMYNAIKLVESLSGNNEEYVTRALATNELIRKYGNKEGKVGNIDLKTFADELSQEDLEVLLSGRIVLDENKSEEEIKRQIEVLQNNMKPEDLSIAVSLRETLASDKNSKGKLTKKQIEEAQAEAGKLGLEYDTEFSDFENKSQLNQVETLNDIVQDKIEINKNYLKNVKSNAEEELKVLDETKNKYEEMLQLRKDNPGGKQTDEMQADFEEAEKNWEAIKDHYNDVEEATKGLGLNIIDDTIFDNLIAGIDGVISEAEVLKSLAEDIGENQVIAAEDIERFGKNFPDILAAEENYTFLQDGSLQLTKQGQEALQQTVDLYKEKLVAENESYQLELQQQADLQKASAEYYQEQADNLRAYLNGQKTGAQTEADMAQSLTDYKAKLTEITGQNDEELNRVIQENLGNTTNIAQMDTQQIYDYQVGIGKAAEAASLAYEYQHFEDPNLRPGGGGGAATNVTSYNRKDTGLETQVNELTDAQIEEMINQYDKMAEKATNRYSDYISKLRGLGAGVASTLNAMDRAASGKGGKESKSKSSGSKKDKDKDEKEQEDEFDRYWEIKKAIDAVDRALQRLDKDQENLYGQELINSLRQENELIAQQAANYERLYEMQQQEAAELREQLGTMGVMFDASGAITNYAAATSAALQAYSAAIEQYNAGLIDETTLKVFEKSYENFKKLLERYDTLYYTEMQDTQDKIDEARRKQLANNLKAWEVEIQLRLDMTKAKRDQNDFLKDIKQDFKKVYKDLRIDVKYDRKNFKTLVDDVNTTIGAINDVEREIDIMMSGGQSSMFESVSQAQEKLKELQEQLLEQGKDLYALYKQVWDTYLDGIDQVKDQFDELMSRYEHFTKELEFQKELIELLYGDKAYDLMDKYYETQSKNINAQIDSLKQQADFWQSEFQKSYETALKTGSKVDIDDFTTWTEDMKKAYENMIDSQEKLNDLVLEGVKVLQDQYLNSINQIIDAMNQQVQGTSFDEMKRDQEYTQKLADLFLDDVQKAYKVQTLANKIDQSIANTSNLKAQQKLQQLREKDIEYLRTKNNLTQEDVDLAEMRYQIALKEIALEDAQNNKTTMKLTRNEQGNWSYQYVADEDDVLSKQQDLLSTMGGYYEKAVEYRNKSAESWQEIYEMMLEELADIQPLMEENFELYEQKRQAILEKYEPAMTALLDNEEVARQEAIYATAAIFGTVCEQDYEAYKNLTNEQKRLVDEYKEVGITSFGELRDYLIGSDGKGGMYSALYIAAKESFENTNITSHAILTQMAKEQALNKDSFTNIILKAIEQMNQATINYQKQLDKLQEVANIDFTKLGDYIDQVSQKIDNMDGTTEKMADNSSQYLDELRRVLEAVAEAWNAIIGKILEAQQAMQDYLAVAAAAQQTSPNSGNGSGGGNGSGTTPGDGGPGDNSGPGSKTEDKTDKFKIIAYDGHHGADVTVESNGGKGFSLDEVHSLYQSNQRTQSEAGLSNFRFQNIVKNAGFPAYRSGGYTGEQNGDIGQPAILHQKELVLNADDTANFLEAIYTMRDLIIPNQSIIDTLTNALSVTFGTLFSSILPINGNDYITRGSSTEQVFNIEKIEFPNATDVDEIREAIITLPNIASQYINSLNGNLG